jgi:ABC-type branched-subunit amino acid transport system substrate-binding protein
MLILSNAATVMVAAGQWQQARTLKSTTRRINQFPSKGDNPMKQEKKGAVTRRTFLAAAGTAAAALSTRAPAQGAPIKIGLSIAQTGGLGAGGKAALLGQQMWRDDVNARGGILGRKVELVVYDDQSNPATTPGIYTKLLDVDKVDLLVAPYGTNPTAPIMPLVKQRGSANQMRVGLGISYRLF